MDNLTRIDESSSCRSSTDPEGILEEYAREIEKLRDAIRRHRDDLGCRERVLHDSILYSVLPEGCSLASGTGAIVKRRRAQEDAEAELQAVKAKLTRIIRLVQEMGR